MTESVSKILAVGVVAFSVWSSTGCATSSSGSNNVPPGNGLVSGGASSIYVVEQSSTGGGSVLQFPVTSTGVASPSATLTPNISGTVECVATDSSGQIYIGVGLNSGQGEILVYPAGSTSVTTPTRTILGAIYPSTASFTTPTSMTVSASGVLYVISNSNINGGTAGYSVTALASTATGQATPLSIIQGTSTQLYEAFGLAVDTAGNTYVSTVTSSSTGAILVFASGATGNAVPSRTITNAQVPYGIAVDSSSNIYTVLDYSNASSASTIVEFAAGASGAATPLKTISGSSTGVTYGGGLRLDSVGNLYMVNATPSGTSATYKLLAFPPTASGNVAPGLSFSSASWASAGSELAVR